MLLLSYPIIRVQSEKSESLDLASYLGLAVWIVGFMFQVIGDWQLRQFKKKRVNNEEVLTTGLWRYTRHPNYFGEAVMWWGIAIIVLPVPAGWGAIISSLLINFLLVKVSGVPFLDRRYAHNSAYQQYKRETNRFIPWFPKVERK
ncbi:3-oxo-5-alpha-steroid 4-dehydrogenase [compost metagenome]